MHGNDLTLAQCARLLAGIPRRDVAAMLSSCFAQCLPKSAVLCRQVDRLEFMFLALSGRVGLFGESARGEALVEIFGPGDAPIIPAVALDMPALLGARILQEGRILMWPAGSFRQEVRSRASLAYGVMLQLSSYWRLLVGQIKDLNLLSAVERLSALLLASAPRWPGPFKAELPGNRGLVAGYLGVAPQSLSRAFGLLRRRGVSRQGQTVTIASAARLRAAGRTGVPDQETPVARNNRRRPRTRSKRGAIATGDGGKQ